MDLETRKYHIIRELFSVKSERIIDTIERTLKLIKQESQEISAEHKSELDSRIDSYKKNPKQALNWKDVKNDW